MMRSPKVSLRARRIQRLLPVLGGVLLLAACDRQVHIDSQPVRARVEINGSFVGYTPLQLHLGSAHRNLRLSSPGYRPIRARLLRSSHCFQLQPGDEPIDLGDIDGPVPPVQPTGAGLGPDRG